MTNIIIDHELTIYNGATFRWDDDLRPSPRWDMKPLMIDIGYRIRPGGNEDGSSPVPTSVMELRTQVVDLFHNRALSFDLWEDHQRDFDTVRGLGGMPLRLRVRTGRGMQQDAAEVFALAERLLGGNVDLLYVDAYNDFYTARAHQPTGGYKNALNDIAEIIQ